MSEVICSTSEARCFRYLDKLSNVRLSSFCTTNISYEILDVACGPSAGIFAGLPHDDTNEPMKPTIPLCAGAGADAGAGGADARADAGVDEDEDDDEDAGAGAGASAGSSAGEGAADANASADVDEDEDEDDDEDDKDAGSGSSAGADVDEDEDAGAGFSRNQTIIASTNRRLLLVDNLLKGSITCRRGVNRRSHRYKRRLSFLGFVSSAKK